MLVVAEKEALCALALVASHGVDAHLLAPAVVVQTLVDICHSGETETVSRGSAVELAQIRRVAATSL